jgi:RHS repeat-associated protein
MKAWIGIYGFVSFSRSVSLACLLALLAAPVAAEVHWVHTDAIGNVRALTDSASNVVERHDLLPFGEEPNVTLGRQPKTFAGKERDNETGLDYFGARYYRANTGRFTTVDPHLDVSATLANPQKWNRYAYVLNNPLTYVDADGRVERTTLDARMLAAERAKNGYVSEGDTLGTVLATAALAVTAAPLAVMAIEAAPFVAAEVSIAFGTCGASATCQSAIHGVADGITGVPSPRGALANEALVCRGGTCTAARFASGSGVTTTAEGKLAGVSVNSANGVGLQGLTKGIPNGQVGVTTAGKIRAAGGQVVSSPTRKNPNHATMSGITANQAERLFTPTVGNPNK